MKLITDISELDFDQTYSYADYIKWKFEERVELIKGKIFRMSPAPNVAHQRVSGRMFRVISNFFYPINCEAFTAPFDVRLEDSIKIAKKARNIFSVVQPDICVICDKNKLDEQGCKGAPDWIIEIVSPSTENRDLKDKKRLYEENGVREYWIVFPIEQIVQAFELNTNGFYQEIEISDDAEIISPALFPNLKIDLSEIFE